METHTDRRSDGDGRPDGSESGTGPERAGTAAERARTARVPPLDERERTGAASTPAARRGER